MLYLWFNLIYMKHRWHCRISILLLPAGMDGSHKNTFTFHGQCRLNFYWNLKNKIHHYSWKEHVRNSKTTEMKYNIALGNVPIPYTPASLAELCTTFRPKVVQISARNTKLYEIRKFCWAIFSAFFNISRPNFAILLFLRCYQGRREKMWGPGAKFSLFGSMTSYFLISARYKVLKSVVTCKWVLRPTTFLRSFA